MLATPHHLRHLIRKYDRPGPRYTSYPTAVDFSSAFTEDEYRSRLQAADQAADETWSIYVHIPFCQARCSFCACSVIASPQHDRIAPRYVDGLKRELQLVTSNLPRRRGLAQLHLGGGTPTYLSPDLLRQVYGLLLETFELAPGAESSIELDPRVTTAEHVRALADLGVNRISLGVQDLDPQVQDHIGRHQSAEQTAALVEQARNVGIESVNVDLVYGLPGQTTAGLEATIQATLALGIDRIALYGYAHVPWIRGNQRRIDPASLPSSEDRLELFLQARAQFEAAGYRPVGMDHFARPEDPLAQAEAAGRLIRNFMGYSVGAGTDILGLGVTAIGDIRGAYVQNTTKLTSYYRALDEGKLPVARGLQCDAEDTLRRRVISDLMCRYRVQRSQIEREFGLQRFEDHFDADLRGLIPLLYDGLVEDDGDTLTVTPLGRLFVRNVAMCFDARLRAKRDVDGPRFSRTV